MMLTLYDTLTRRKVPFAPIDPARVRIYVCGPTVYDRAHIGNARPIIVFDLLFRLLRHIYGAEHVVYVRNITDVDDKINAQAARRGIDIQVLTGKTIANFHDDLKQLGVLPPTIEPRATHHIDDMIHMIARLIETGHAYVAQEHVLFHVPSLRTYGALSGRSIADMQAGARVEVAPYKKDPMDFVLWKPSTANVPSWPSPWGAGRPGWHIECSAMCNTHLGDVIDIHAGGIDLVFPHHENELAQSTCALGTSTMASVWMHNGMLQVEGEKMSKSQGNFVTLSQVLQEWPAEVVRLAMLSTHYRQPINWTLRGLREAERTLNDWYAAVDSVDSADSADSGESDANSNKDEVADTVEEALCDDLNTPRAIAALHALKGEGLRLKSSAALFGLLQEPLHARKTVRRRALAISETEIETSIAERLKARNAKNFAKADRIRDDLAALGVILKDGPEGTTWDIKP